VFASLGPIESALNKPHLLKFVLCLDCQHAVWPVHELGTCTALPVRGLDMTTMQARAFDYACGADGKLWERRHDILAQ